MYKRQALPLCEGGYLDIDTPSGPKRIGITRIHIEEDAGKLIHREDGGTLCDYNRCGVPLIEICLLYTSVKWRGRIVLLRGWLLWR